MIISYQVEHQALEFPSSRLFCLEHLHQRPRKLGGRAVAEAVQLDVARAGGENRSQRNVRQPNLRGNRKKNTGGGRGVIWLYLDA